ncbi:MAG TPA: tRNA pseudouridine(55) synthase TruB, partial [Candidatus Eremiobacteraceae bacterium]|nr:tRNA pseudouridine(55) synthase TruB [Candidatus Eremiobacteraceae bacterium]
SQGPDAGVIDPLRVLALPRVSLEASAANAFRHGNVVDASRDQHDAAAAIVLDRSRIIGVGRIDGGRVEPIRVLDSDAEGATGIEAKV